MKITDILGLLGGLALFLYGMQMMGQGLEAAAGNKMKQLLEKLTANRFMGVAVGAGITAVIQSSSATTVMVVGFVNSGMMNLRQAVWIIMGANIGTTITGQLIALDVGAMAPLFAFAGVAMVTFVKNQKAQHIGEILAGLGILFIGMEMMSEAMLPLRELPAFINLITKFSNPLIGILAGALFTAVIQSSSASVGILQALATSGVIGLPSAVYVLFGQNIGTCITAVLASIGTSRNAKRTTVIHLMFNIIGTIVFTIICMVTPLVSLVESFTPYGPAAQIANMHTLFNIVTTLLLLPLGTNLASLAEKILPDREEDMEEGMSLRYLKSVNGVSESGIGYSAIYIEQLQQEVFRMMNMAKKNVHDSFQAFLDSDIKIMENVEKREEYIDFLNKEISCSISKMLVYETNEKSSETISAYFNALGNIERIGDHAVNISGYTKIKSENQIIYSEGAKKEIEEMQQVCGEIFAYLEEPKLETVTWLSKISALEQKIDDMTVKYRELHIERMKQGVCSEEACILYSEMLTDFERIGDHVLNIAQEIAAVK
ncbi:MAG: Na/Pi cotransporter family protein [Lachnoclostridium edouardi]|uniref:Na/Pi cotransporter family protein n=1 Tax=Lachnoclostridium edouardi TaxID=1926283 RepID=UPI0026DACD70|nr:Na/Pi cotransporter family protein [Lachnoclostridium edouardi]MDO4278846.1 Na/Pi cotransporter family protein [Lachnoclostridium edouardi]